MADYDLKRLQERLLNILLEFDRVCKERGLRYTICGGTMLGAVRHGGFIPWDDDLDVSMPRPDYDRLVKHSKEWLPEYLEFVCAENDPKYPLPFGKIQDARTTLIERRHLYYLGGCYIDIFPFDAWPDGNVARRFKAARYNYYKKMLYLVHRDPYRHGKGPASWAPRLVRKLYTMKEIQQKMRKLMRSADFDAAVYAGSYTDGMHRLMKRELTGNYAPIEFEGHTVMGILDADPYLRAMYGDDYMTIPPVGKREQHNFDYLDLDHPYKDYHE